MPRFTDYRTTIPCLYCKVLSITRRVFKTKVVHFCRCCNSMTGIRSKFEKLEQ